MYPIGFTTMAEYLERHGMRTRIVNLAVRMLDDAHFDVEKYISNLDAMAYGIDLHWLPMRTARSKLRKSSNIIIPMPGDFRGFSASYFYEELIRYPR